MTVQGYARHFSLFRLIFNLSHSSRNRSSELGAVQGSEEIMTSS
jgi:hypothetical protein